MGERRAQIMSARDRDETMLRAEDDEDLPDWLATQEILAEARKETKRFMWFATVPILLLIGTGIALFAATRDNDDATSADDASPALQSEVDEGDAAAGDGSDTEAGSDGSDVTQPEDADGATIEDTPAVAAGLPEPPASAPYVDATLTNNIFVLSGVVPDEQTKLALEGKAELAYSPFFSSELEVDESVGTADWLVAAPEVVGLLPMITDGTIRIQDDSVTLAGRSPNPEYAALFEGAVGQITGLPVSSEGIQITNLVPPRFVATVNAGEVTLEGEIPSAAIAETFVQGAAAVYGPDNVTSTMTVDEGTYISFWMYTMPGIFQLFQPFPSYEIQVMDGVTSGRMQGGVLFALNSSEISPEAAQVLGVGVALLTRDRSLDMTVIGHTDSQGPDDLNQRLSVARAESVVAFLVDKGVDPGRLTSDGRGEKEPLASNDTAEGRALNRRVEFLFD